MSGPWEDFAPVESSIDMTRPKIANPDGSFSTERTITIESDGKHYLIPTIVGGKQLPIPDAINLWKTGKNKEVGVFPTEEEANAAAVQRSERIGNVRGPWEDFASSPTPAPEEGPKRRQYGVAANIAGAVQEPIAQMATGMIAKPVSDIAGLSALGLEGLRHAGLPLAERDPLAIQRIVQQAMTYSPQTPAGQISAEYNPLALFGKGVDWLGQRAQNAISSDTNPALTALGSGVHEAINQAPMFLGLGAPVAAAATESALKSGAREVMQSALKPPLKTLQTGKAGEVIDTLLDRGINVTKRGVETLREGVEGLNDNIKQLIANSPAIIDKVSVASRLSDLLNRFQKQVTPLSDIASIQKAWNEFMNHPLLSGNDIPVQLAQELKQGTYKALGDKQYGELKGADIEAQKALARGLKEEIANAVPEVRPLNAEESKLLNALSLTERRVLISANKNPMGLALLSWNPLRFATFLADRSELFKSLVARMLNTASEATPGMNMAGPLGGAAITQQAEQSKAIR